MREGVPAERETEDQDHGLKSRDEMKGIAERLLARLVAEQVAGGMGHSEG